MTARDRLLLCLFTLSLLFVSSCSDGTVSLLQSSVNERSEDELIIDLSKDYVCGDPLVSTRSKGGRPGSHPSPIPDISDACQAVLQNFSDSVADFSRCLAMNARPITICQECICQYLKVDYWFKNISSGSGASCDVELLNRDHLQVVQTLAKQSERYWTTAQCPNCYSKDGADPPRLCNDTHGFFDKLIKVNTCINNTQGIDSGDPEAKNQSQVCALCRKDYIELNEYYERLNTKYSNRLCMDLMDAMNITRHLWSSKYKCTMLQVEGLQVILASVGFLLLPVIYYFGNRFVASAKDTKLVPQKRMSFVQTSYSSTNLQR